MTDEKSLSLFGITEEMRAMNDLLEIDGGEIEDAHEELIEYVEKLLTTKADGIIGFIGYLESEIVRAKTRQSEIGEFISRAENKIESIKKYSMSCMERLDVAEINGEFDRLVIPKPRKIVFIEDKNKLPPHLLRIKQVIEPDKKAIKKELESGKEITGARLAEGKKSLAVKRRKI